jgi:hypothetical protein
MYPPYPPSLEAVLVELQDLHAQVRGTCFGQLRHPQWGGAYPPQTRGETVNKGGMLKPNSRKRPKDKYKTMTPHLKMRDQYMERPKSIARKPLNTIQS